MKSVFNNPFRHGHLLLPGFSFHGFSVSLVALVGSFFCSFVVASVDQAEDEECSIKKTTAGS